MENQTYSPGRDEVTDSLIKDSQSPGRVQFLKVRDPSLGELLVEWSEELDTIKDRLAEIGERGESFEYNILSASALRLMECIADLTYIEGWMQGRRSGGANE